MNLTSKDEERLWTYVHGEMNESERRELERDVAKDPDLRHALENLQQFHRELWEFTPLTKDPTYEDEMVERLIAAIETEPADPQAQDPPAAPDVVRPSLPLRNPRRRMLWVSLGSVAAIAACLLILVGVRHEYGGSIRWLRPEYGEAGAIRSGEGAQPGRAYTREQAEAFAAVLRKAIQDRYDGHPLAPVTSSWLGDRTQWAVRLQFQEFSGGAFEVGIEAYRPGRREVIRRWTSSYDSDAAFRDHVEAFGSRIADALARMSAENGG